MASSTTTGGADREGRHALRHLGRGGVNGGSRRRDALGIPPAVDSEPPDPRNQRSSNAVASRAMIIDGGVRSAEHHLPDEIIGQEIMWETFSMKSKRPTG